MREQKETNRSIAFMTTSVFAIRWTIHLNPPISRIMCALFCISLLQIHDCCPVSVAPNRNANLVCRIKSPGLPHKVSGNATKSLYSLTPNHYNEREKPFGNQSVGEDRRLIFRFFQISKHFLEHSEYQNVSECIQNGF